MLNNRSDNKILFSFFVCSVFFFWSCTKLDTTTLGSDLIPEVDNINTFADTFEISTTNAAFDDSTKVRIDEYHALGLVTDPSFGSLQADLFLQLKPTFFPFYFGTNIKDSLLGDGDSAILCLAYTGQNWGNVSQELKLQANTLNTGLGSWWDSTSYYRPINFPQSYSATPISDEVSISINSLANTIKVGVVDTVTNQIRIKLSNDFKNKLFKTFNADSSGSNNAYRSDSLFKQLLSGFVIKATSGNAFVYINLLDARTRLELHYRKKSWNSDSGVLASSVDTVYTNFTFNSSAFSGITLSSHANKISFNGARSPLPTDGSVLIQTNPGTYANLKIPRLNNFITNDSNRVIHRAELQVYQTPDPVTTGFQAPEYLYLDLIDSTTSLQWKPIYFDLNPSSYYNPDNSQYYYPFNEGISENYFGSKVKTKANGMAYYKLNLTRYLQDLVTNRRYNYQLRLFAPHNLSYAQYDRYITPYTNLVAKGSAKLAGGSYPDKEYRMKLVVIYSKIK